MERRNYAQVIFSGMGQTSIFKFSSAVKMTMTICMQVIGAIYLLVSLLHVLARVQIILFWILWLVTPLHRVVYWSSYVVSPFHICKNNQIDQQDIYFSCSTVTQSKIILKYFYNIKQMIRYNNTCNEIIENEKNIYIYLINLLTSIKNFTK